MPTYNILGGGQLTATTDLGLIQGLRQDAQQWVPSVSIEDFMEGMAARCKVYDGSIVRIDSVANFVSDLKQCGVVTLV
ncbi:hypothetical protein [Hymenobacter sp. BT190]|uniref:hypothetical protein n=1 Tax=Hymenobacter sp. BT190 TaxID=2763505 RepID=UPI0016519478|nr:hypothetical protein [Hymenobacter sp. BT190]MBC6698870.1 hypothetical protein [Hymenobacter sp. BT190]